MDIISDEQREYVIYNYNHNYSGKYTFEYLKYCSNKYDHVELLSGKGKMKILNDKNRKKMKKTMDDLKSVVNYNRDLFNLTRSKCIYLSKTNNIFIMYPNMLCSYFIGKVNSISKYNDYITNKFLISYYNSLICNKIFISQ